MKGGIPCNHFSNVEARYVNQSDYKYNNKGNSIKSIGTMSDVKGDMIHARFN
jgi:hypothetical protein